MNNKIKTYKIMVDSKPFANMRGASPAEVAKKAASKILVNSLNRARFSIFDAKTGKIRHYDAKLENLVRPYHKNGKLVKKRIVVKNIGKQVGGTYLPDLKNLNDPIFRFFPEGEEGEYKIKIEDSTVKIYNKHNQNNLCIEFVIRDRELSISELHHCGYKGSTNLRKIIGYAKKLNENSKIIDLIRLYDASYFKEYEDISLDILYILSTGSSWYNYFGFKSNIFDEEIKHNQQFLSMIFTMFLDECIKKIIKNKLEYYHKLYNKLNNYRKRNQTKFRNSQLAKLKRNIKKIKSYGIETVIEIISQELDRQKKIFIEKFGNPNIKELFTQIKKKLQESKLEELEELEELEAIIELFNFIKNSQIILYNPILKLEL